MWVDYWGGGVAGGKGYVAPLSNYWGAWPPGSPSSYAYDFNKPDTENLVSSGIAYFIG